MKQIMTCNIEMYAVYKDPSGEHIHIPVLGFGLNDDGEIVALVYDSLHGMSPERGSDNFITYSLYYPEE